VKASLFRRRELHGEEVRVSVSSKKKDLKEQEARCPYGGGYSKPWQDVLAQNQLNLKQEKGGNQYCQTEELRIPVAVYALRELDYLDSRLLLG